MSSVAILLALGDWGAKASVLLLATGLAVRATSQAATRRYLWVVAFAAVAATPILSSATGAAAGLFSVAAKAVPISVPSTPSQPQLLELGPIVVLAAWLAGVGMVLLNGALGWVALRRALRRSVDWVPAQVDLAALGEVAGVARPWQLRLSGSDSPPVALTWGWRRPVVLLPKSAVRWEDDRLNAVLLHELAHVRRADGAIQTLVGVVCAALWFNPLVWLARDTLRREAESVADGAVLEAGVRPSRYASALLETALEVQACPGRRIAAVPFMRRGELERRIAAVVHPGRPSRRLTRRQSTVVLVSALFASAVLAPVRLAVAEHPQAEAMSAEFLAGYRAGLENFRRRGGSPSLRPNATDAYRRWRLETAAVDRKNPSRLTAAARQEMERRLRNRLLRAP